MRTRALAATLALVAAVAVLAALALRRREPPPGDAAGPGTASPGTGPALAPRPVPPAPSPAPAPRPSMDPARLLAEALRAGPDAARRAARDLRLLLRTDASALARARETLLDPATPADVRGVLALVLGTLPRDAGDPALLEALARFPDDPGFVRLALLALGAQREPEDDDDVFGLGDRPYGASGPGGIGITVRRRVPPGEARDALLSHLSASSPEARAASGRALAETVPDLAVRTAFLGRLSGEPSDDVLSTLGEPLAKWAGAPGAPAAEAEAVAAALWGRLGEAGLDGFRFRLEDEIERLPPSGERSLALAALADPGRPFEVRSFALAALARASRRADVAHGPARRAFEAGLSDADPAIRDLSARSLRDLPATPAGTAALAAVARSDPAWNVRHAALETLAATAPRDDAVLALRAGLSDPDRRVAERAAALLRSLEGR